MGVIKTSDHIQIKSQMPNPIQEPPASSKAPNEDFKDMDVLCTLKIRIESVNSEHGLKKTVTISKSLSGCKISVRNLQGPPKPQKRI